MRRQQSRGMAEEQEQDADVEQIAAQRNCLSRSICDESLFHVLLAVEADQAAEEEDRQRDVGVDAKQEIVQ
jgi:hypothetical protein